MSFSSHSARKIEKLGGIIMSDKKPINDAMEHMKNIEGYPTNVDIKKLPKPLRYFGYFFIGFFSISALIILIGTLLD